MSTAVTPALLREVLGWASATGRPVAEDEASSWDEWPHGHPSRGLAALARGGKFCRLGEQLLTEWKSARNGRTVRSSRFSSRTGSRSVLDLV